MIVSAIVPSMWQSWKYTFVQIKFENRVWSPWFDGWKYLPHISDCFNCCPDCQVCGIHENAYLCWFLMCKEGTLAEDEMVGNFLYGSLIHDNCPTYATIDFPLCWKIYGCWSIEDNKLHS